MENTFKVGSVVGIPTSILLGEIKEVMYRLKYVLRPEIYGVIKEIRYDNKYVINLATWEVLDMGEDMQSQLDI